ncbi:MAG: RNA methyltransferase [Halobacteriovoraceae bacterium]|nr:RNA methyltransferase [Halobacteriovoraceae bacterium]
MQDLIFGNHSIAEAIQNPNRGSLKLFCTEDSKKELQKLHFNGQKLPEKVEVKMLSLHKLKEEGKRYLREFSFKEQRVPSNIFLIADSFQGMSISNLYEKISKGEKVRLLALDQVTDVHNLGAISRTACFYGIDALIYGRKSKDSLSPGFYRVSSGAFEHLPMIQTSNLGKILTKLNDMGVTCVGLAEESTTTDFKQEDNSLCLVLGTEESGLSHATRRVLSEFVALQSKGEIKSLNVSVAAALAMEKFLVLD